MRRVFIIPLALASLALGAGFFSNTAFAQSTPTDQTALAAVKTKVLGKVAAVPADWKQLCNGSEKAGGDASSFGSLFTTYCLTPKASADGSTAFGVPYKANDSLKCTSEINSNLTEQFCAVTHPGGATDYYDAGNAHTDYVTTDASGKITGGAVGATSNSVTGVANACVNGSGSDCAKAATNSLTGALAGVGSDILRAVASTILSFSNFLLGLAGAALNYVVYYAVFKFGSLIGNSPGVLLAWGILRDIANMLLLFGFIFLGVATILDSDKFATKKAIPQLLIFAILMNFSLFACEAIIDVANGTSSLLYSQADPMSAQCNGSDVGRNLGDQCSFLNYGIAGHIMQSTGLSTFWQNVTGDANPVALLALALFATIGTIVCLAAAIMLTIRLVVLTFLMISSPIGFAGMAIPFFHKFSNDWWNRVIHQSFFAPIMFLLIFISLKLADSFSSATSQSAGLGAVATSPNALDMGVILVFMLVCGFLLASIIVAHRFGAMGAQGAIGFSKKLVLGTYGGIGGLAGRNTLGRYSASLQKSYQSAVGKSKFARGLLVTTGLDTGIMNLTNKAKNAKYGGGVSFADEQKRIKERKEELEKEGRKSRNEAAVKAAKNAAEMSTALGQMTDAERREMIKKGVNIELISISLSSAEFKKAMDDKDIPDSKKIKLQTERYKDLDSNVQVLSDPAASPADKAKARSAVRGTSAKDLQYAPTEILSKAALIRNLSDSQREDLGKNENLNRTISSQIKAFDPIERIKHIFDARGGAAVAPFVQNRLKPKQVAKLPEHMLADAAIANVLTPEMLSAINENADISRPTRNTIKGILSFRRAHDANLDTYLSGPGGTLWV